MHVSALEGGHLNIPWNLIAAGGRPDDTMFCPSLSFFLCHSKSNKRVVFDLGIRRNIKEFVTIPIEGLVPHVKQTATESLEAGGVPPSSVDVVVLSHLHFDQ